MNGDVFHEWPLVIFTTLAIMGAGLLTAPIVAGLVAPAGAAATPVMLPGVALLAAGLVVSLAHLGLPQRSPLALARVGRSRLSSEIALAGLALAAGIAAVALPYSSPVVTLLPALFGVAFLAALGLVYSLPGQATWRGAVVCSPLTMGLGFGALGLGAAWNGSTAVLAPIASVLLVADAGLFLLRRQRLAEVRAQTGRADAPVRAARDKGLGRPQVRYPGAFAHREAMLAARFILVDILPGILLLSHLPKGAAGALGLGILVDRLSFYLLAAQHTTEGGIAAVEDRL